MATFEQKNQSLQKQTPESKKVTIKKQKNYDVLYLAFLVLIISMQFRVDAMKRDFWHDEAFQYLYSQKPLSFIVDSNDVHPPLFNMITHFVQQYLTSVLALRLFMIVLSMWFLFEFWKTGKELYDPKVANVSTLIMAVVPSFLHYSTEYRNYVFALILVMIQIRLFNRIVRRGYSPDDGLKYILVSAAMLYTHYLTGFIILAQIVYQVKYHRRNYQVTEYFVIGVISLPLFIYLIRTLPNIQSFWFKDITLISLLSTFSYYVSPPNKLALGLVPFTYGLLMYGLIRFKVNKQAIQIILYATLPVCLMFLISQVFPFYHHRYFLFGGLTLFWLLGWVAVKIGQRIEQFEYFVVAVFMVFVMFSGVLISYDSPLSDASVALRNSTLPFVHTSTFSMSPMKVYLPEKNHYLLTNLTRQQLFTAGGSVVEDYELIQDKYVGLPEYLYVSDQPGSGTILFNKGGLYVTEVSNVCET